jgi:hypothetical protein
LKVKLANLTNLFFSYIKTTSSTVDHALLGAGSEGFSGRTKINVLLFIIRKMGQRELSVVFGLVFFLIRQSRIPFNGVVGSKHLD